MASAAAGGSVDLVGCHTEGSKCLSKTLAGALSSLSDAGKRRDSLRVEIIGQEFLGLPIGVALRMVPDDARIEIGERSQRLSELRRSAPQRAQRAFGSRCPQRRA